MYPLTKEQVQRSSALVPARLPRSRAARLIFENDALAEEVRQLEATLKVYQGLAEQLTQQRRSQ